MVRDRAADPGQRRGTVVEIHVEHAGLVAGQRHDQQVGHRLVIDDDVVDVGGLRALVAVPGDRAGLQRLGPGHFDVELLLDLAQRGEILVELGLVARAQPRIERSALLAHRREHRAPRHRHRIGGELALVGIAEAAAEDARIEPGGRGLGGVEVARAAPAQRIARIAGGRHLEAAEAGAGADRVADGDVERGGGQRAFGGRRHAGADRDPARIVRQVGPPVERHVEVRQDVDLGLVRRDRREFGLEVVVLAHGVGEPARRVDPQAPEPHPEAHRQRCGAHAPCRCERGTVAIDKQVEQRQPDRHRRAVDGAAQQRAAVQLKAHRAFSSKATCCASPNGRLGTRHTAGEVASWTNSSAMRKSRAAKAT